MLLENGLNSERGNATILGRNQENIKLMLRNWEIKRVDSLSIYSQTGSGKEDLGDGDRMLGLPVGVAKKITRERTEQKEFKRLWTAEEKLAKNRKEWLFRTM